MIVFPNSGHRGFALIFLYIIFIIFFVFLSNFKWFISIYFANIILLIIFESSSTDSSV